MLSTKKNTEIGCSVWLFFIFNLVNYYWLVVVYLLTRKRKRPMLRGQLFCRGQLFHCSFVRLRRVYCERDRLAGHLKEPIAKARTFFFFNFTHSEVRRSPAGYNEAHHALSWTWPACRAVTYSRQLGQHRTLVDNKRALNEISIADNVYEMTAWRTKPY